MQAAQLNSNSYDYDIHGQSYRDSLEFTKNDILDFCIYLGVKEMSLLKRVDPTRYMLLLKSVAAEISEAGYGLSPSFITKFLKSSHNYRRATNYAQKLINDNWAQYLIKEDDL